MKPETINKNLNSFLKYNKIKYTRFQQILPNQNFPKVLNSIPLLLSVNNSRLPGYVDGDTPTGVFDYSPERIETTFLTLKFGKVAFNLNQKDPVVEMLALIGSIGTIAYNKKSDFDYWVCINRSKLSEQQYLNFRKKVTKIQEWATNELDTEVHLFINDTESIKKNIYDEDEDEAFGSTIGGILKDEFFRSSIILHGKTPLWWVVPVNTTNQQYDEILKNLPENIRQNQLVDIGNLYKLPKEEFIGAALFQIIKSLGNPFKSILKLGILEKYLFQPENAPLISHKVKHFIQNDKITNTVLDSYLMMFKEVYSYYEATMKSNPEILDSLRMNLYLKINPQLAKYKTLYKKTNMPYRVEEMFKYCQDWKWTPQKIADLDNFDNWDFNRVLRFWDQVQKLMLLSYQKISKKIPDLNLQNRISESDFKLLVRKIRAQYARGQFKIPKFISFKETKHEPILYIEPLSENISEVSWVLYKKITSRNSSAPAPSIVIHKTDNLIKLMAWAVINGIYDHKFSRITIQSGYQHINKDVAIHCLNALGEFFTEKRMETHNKYIVKNVFNILNFISLDFNLKTTNQIRTIDYIYYTSWDESFYKSYSNASELVNVFEKVISDSKNISRPFEDYCTIYCPEHYKKPYKDIIYIFKESYKFFQKKNPKTSKRLITKMIDSYVVFTEYKGRIESTTVNNFIQLSSYINLRPIKNAEYNFVSSEDKQLMLLEYIKENAQQHDISVFYQTKGNFIFIYIINETGNIFFSFCQEAEKYCVLGNLYAFITQSIKAIRNINRFSPLSTEKTKFFEITENRFGQYETKNSTEKHQNWFLTQFNKSAILKCDISDKMGNDTFYNITFPDGIESGFMNLNDYYAVAQKIRNLKSEGSKVQCIVAEVNFLDKKKDNNLDSTIFFEEKYRNEFEIKKNLNI